MIAFLGVFLEPVTASQSWLLGAAKSSKVLLSIVLSVELDLCKCTCALYGMSKAAGSISCIHASLVGSWLIFMLFLLFAGRM